MSTPSTPKAVAKAVDAMHTRLMRMADALEAREDYMGTDAEHALNRAIAGLEEAVIALQALAREGGQ